MWAGVPGSQRAGPEEVVRCARLAQAGGRLLRVRARRRGPAPGGGPPRAVRRGSGLPRRAAGRAAPDDDLHTWQAHATMPSFAPDTLSRPVQNAT